MQESFQMQMDAFLPLRDVVFNTLRQAILTEDLKPGERLMEIHLSNKFGVRRTPLIVAIRKHDLVELVSVLPRRGAEVAQTTDNSMNDGVYAPLAIDPCRIVLAVDVRTDGALQPLDVGGD